MTRSRSSRRWSRASRSSRTAMRAAAREGFATATDLADYLVKKGLPFRDAHEAVANAVRVCVERGVDLADLSLAELRTVVGDAGPGVAELVGDDVHAVLTLDGSIASRHHVGGTAPLRVRDEVAAHRMRLDGR